VIEALGLLIGQRHHFPRSICKTFKHLVYDLLQRIPMPCRYRFCHIQVSRQPPPYLIVLLACQLRQINAGLILRQNV
jgi:hypothetical protein